MQKVAEMSMKLDAEVEGTSEIDVVVNCKEQSEVDSEEPEVTTWSELEYTSLAGRENQCPSNSGIIQFSKNFAALGILSSMNLTSSVILSTWISSFVYKMKSQYLNPVQNSCVCTYM